MEIYLCCTVDKALKKPSLILRNVLRVRQHLVSLRQCRTWVRVHKLVIPSSLAVNIVTTPRNTVKQQNMVVPNRDLPKRLPLLILKDKVLLPGSSMRIAVRDNAR